MSVKKNVEAIMTLFPATRNNDRLLQILYWTLVDGVEVPTEFGTRFLLGDCSEPESIRRTRALVQANGDLEPTDPDVFHKRLSRRY